MRARPCGARCLAGAAAASDRRRLLPSAAVAVTTAVSVVGVYDSETSCGAARTRLTRGAFDVARTSNIANSASVGEAPSEAPTACGMLLPCVPRAGMDQLPFPDMKIVIWSFLSLFFVVCAIGGLLRAVNGHDAPSIIRGLVISALFSWWAWGSWKRASRPRTLGMARIEEPHRRPWRRR